MDSSTASTSEESAGKIVASRSSVIQSSRVCGLSVFRINKEDLQRKLSIPKYLRHAIRDSIRSKDVNAAVDRCQEGSGGGREAAPDGPMVVFVNSKSGGRHGPELKERLQQLMGEEQVLRCLFFLSFYPLLFLSLSFSVLVCVGFFWWFGFVIEKKLLSVLLFVCIEEYKISLRMDN